MCGRLNRALFLLAFFAALRLDQAAFSQQELKWTSPDGREISGEFLRIEEKTLVIRLATGKEAKLPLSSLGLESHLQALKLAKPEAFAKPLMKAPLEIKAAEPVNVVPVGSVLDSPFGTDPTIDQFLRTYVNEWKRGNNFVLWHMLPPRMQQDSIRVVNTNMQSLGPQQTTLISSGLSTLASLASKKSDWVRDSELSRLFAMLFPYFGEDADAREKNWPIMVGMLQKVSAPELWEPSNFEPNAVPRWLASMSESIAYVRQAIPGMEEISFNVLSQSSDRAEVEFVFGGNKPQVYNFQKVGNVWVVPERMNELRETIDKELANSSTTQQLNLFAGMFAIASPLLNKLDQAKTKEEFDQAMTVLQAGIGQRLGSGQSRSPGAILGLPFSVTGLASTLFESPEE